MIELEVFSQALEGVASPAREAFILVKAERLTYAEAAQLLGLPAESVGKLVRECSQILGAAMREGSAERRRERPRLRELEGTRA